MIENAKGYMCKAAFDERMRKAQLGQDTKLFTIYEMVDGRFCPVMYRAQNRQALPQVKEPEEMGILKEKIVEVRASEALRYFGDNYHSIIEAMTVIESREDLEMIMKPAPQKPYLR